jgi:uncharacterized RDD family membrane protein YckC
MIEEPVNTVPAGVAAGDRYKTISPRLVALFIDFLIFAPLFLVRSWVFQLTDILLFRLIFGLFQSWAPLVYTVLMHGLAGQTLGKMCTRVKVYDLSERPISIKQAILRSIVEISLALVGVVLTLVAYGSVLMSAVADITPSPLDLTRSRVNTIISSIWLVAEIIVVLLNSKRRAIHDLIAHTVVLKVGAEAESPAAPHVRKIMVLVAALAAVLFLLYLVFYLV